MYPEQSNTRHGGFPLEANEDLTGKKSRVVLIVDNSGPKAALPSALTDQTPYVLLDEGALGANVPLEALDPNKNYRLRVKGTLAPGDDVVMADPATPADAGMVRELPIAAGTYILLGKAEESAVDGQLALIRPFRVGTEIVVPV